MNRKYRRSLIVGGCLLCLLTGCAGNQNSNYEQGALDLENKEYESAIENFELAVAEKEHTAEALRGEGIAYLRLGNYEEADVIGILLHVCILLVLIWLFNGRIE